MKRKQIMKSIIAVVLLLNCFTYGVIAAETYGEVSQRGDTLTIELNHTKLAGKMVSFMVYHSEGDIENIETQYIGQIGQGTADENGHLIFSDVRMPIPESGEDTYDIYIGYEENTSKIKLGSVTMPAGSAEARLGDMNGDGKLTAVDALLVLTVGINPSQEQLERGDMNGDQRLDIADSQQILEYASGYHTAT
ncbi:MAG: dockerin type I repeat-containing protein [Lachnospiraceae bacterium]